MDTRWNMVAAMNNLPIIHGGKTPTRIHFIVEWAEHYGMKQSDIVRELGVDKGLVSRWFSGTLPKHEYLERLAALFQMEGDINRLFRHPNDDWLLKFFQDKSEADRERARELLELMFRAG